MASTKIVIQHPTSSVIHAAILGSKNTFCGFPLPSGSQHYEVADHPITCGRCRRYKKLCIEAENTTYLRVLNAIRERERVKRERADFIKVLIVTGAVVGTILILAMAATAHMYIIGG